MVESSAALPDAVLCPICREFMGAPVSLGCGHTYCDFCLREWAERPGCASCPLCQKPIPSPFPNINLALRDLMCVNWPAEAAAAQLALANLPKRKRTVSAYNFLSPDRLPMHFDMAVAVYCAENKITAPEDQRCVALALYAHLGGINNKAFPLTRTVSGARWDEQSVDDVLLAMVSSRWSSLSGTRKYRLNERLPPCLKSIWWPHLRPYSAYAHSDALKQAVETELARIQ